MNEGFSKYRLAPKKGELTSLFSAKALEDKVLYEDAKGDIELTGLIPPSANISEKEKKEKKQRLKNAEKFNQIFLLMLQTKIWLIETMEQLLEELNELGKQLSEVDQGLQTVEGLLLNYRDTGSSDFILETYLNDPWFRKQIEDWENENDSEFAPYSDHVDDDLRGLSKKLNRDSEQLMLTAKEKELELARVSHLLEQLEEAEIKTKSGELSLNDAKQCIALIRPEEECNTQVANIHLDKSLLDIPLP